MELVSLEKQPDKAPLPTSALRSYRERTSDAKEEGSHQTLNRPVP